MLKPSGSINRKGDIGKEVAQSLRYSCLKRSEIPELVRLSRENMAQIIMSAWGVEWKDETLLETLLDDGLLTEVAHQDDRIVGYYVLDQRGDYAFVEVLQVAKEFQGQGLGRKMMDRIEEFTARSGLEGVELCVQSTNDKAIAFYESLGYRYVSRERNNLLFRKTMATE